MFKAISARHARVLRLTAALWIGACPLHAALGADSAGAANGAGVLNAAGGANAVGAPNEAGAPDAVNSSAGGSSSSGGLEEIVVTATRREENISKVPISVTALSQDDLDQKGIKDFTGMVRFTPGVSIDTSGTNAISIRGISSSGGAGTTGIYIDDTPIQMRALGFNPDDTLPKTFDVDRVEVLRGPQGTLFGSGSEGGTVRYIMTQPSVTTDSTYLRAESSYTQYGAPSYEAGIAHGGPIIDDVLGFRASIWYRRDGGWINDVSDTTGALIQPNANYTGTVAARLALLYKPAEQRQHHAELHVSEQAAEQHLDLLARLLQPGRRRVQRRNAGAHRDSRQVPASGAEGPGRLRACDADFEQLLLLSQ